MTLLLSTVAMGKSAPTQREGPPEYSGKMLGSSIQGIQAEYSVGSENVYFSKVDKNNFHKNVNRKKLKKIMKI